MAKKSCQVENTLVFAEKNITYSYCNIFIYAHPIFTVKIFVMSDPVK